MNEKTMNQIAEMKNQTVGVEVEMNNITRKAAAKLAAEFFGTGRSEYTAGRNGYETYSAWDNQGREWKFQKDVSIAGPDSEKCELVTPILHYEDIELLQELIRRLRRAGAKSDASRGCGVHIHIGANGHTPQTLRNLANIMASHESLLADSGTPYREHQQLRQQGNEPLEHRQGHHLHLLENHLGRQRGLPQRGQNLRNHHALRRTRK